MVKGLLVGITLYMCVLVTIPTLFTGQRYSLSTRQIFIAYGMKNRRGKSGSKRHDDACRNVTEASHVVYLIFVNVIVRLCHECQRVCKQRAEDMRTEALD